jgi:hypothetical protein
MILVTERNKKYGTSIVVRVPNMTERQKVLHADGTKHLVVVALLYVSLLSPGLIHSCETQPFSKHMH